jgi:hypothetical protein
VDREALRALTTDLLLRLQADPSIPQHVLELLDTFARRLDRLELGTFGTEDETPTKPDRRPSSGGMAAVKGSLAETVGAIFDEAKRPPK